MALSDDSWKLKKDFEKQQKQGCDPQIVYLSKKIKSFTCIWRLVTGIISIVLSIFGFTDFFGFLILAGGIVSLVSIHKVKRRIDLTLLILFTLGVLFGSILLSNRPIGIFLYIWCILCAIVSIILLLLPNFKNNIRPKWPIVVSVVAVIFLLFSIPFLILDFSTSEDDFIDVADPETDTIEQIEDSDASEKMFEEEEIQENEEVETEKEASDQEEENDQKEDNKQSYIDSCISVDYTSVERSPDEYNGLNIVVSGKVIQVSEGLLNSVTLRVDESSGNVWYVTYTRSDGEDRILEDDNVTIYGTCTGTRTYTSVLRSRITVPSIRAEYVVIN